ncbi:MULTISPECIES: hypothetical protein [Kitasatospora]|uniref:Lipoprotein n=1 Tax=Kitasatospora cathayae TaxID=3004092 RepID=A0ABY7Q1V6_9ACTN|nr:hypothetical protein [Kitasatospora sp. HUAS 3-15]WBP86614.1 hypothetical protein O1G21_12690 [Kitasatospora sp. HUAS 3-15]
MAVPRILLAAAALTATALAGLTGCTPADSRPTVAAASSAAALADDGADDPLDDDDDLADDGSYAAAGAVAAPEAPEAAETPAPECTAPVVTPGHQVLIVVAAGPAELTAQPARFACTPPHYEPTGTPVHYGFAAAGVTATLVDRPHEEAAKPVELDELVTHLNDCLAERDPADPYACYGNAYDVVLDSHGRIMRISEVEVPTP